ncbi:MAG: sulfotransferase [Chloroflexi bacterium]|nr:sulfotransferase [Chloroflexota bacterium]
MPRSGTNFLYEQLSMHPDCGGTARISEGFLIANVHHLAHFVDEVHRSWNMLWWPHEEELKEPLLKAMGQGLEAYARSLASPSWIARQSSNNEFWSGVKPSPPVVIVRTPSVRNLDLLPKLTQTKVLIIVRNGRSIIESGMRTFGWFFENSVQQWAKSADLIQKSVSTHPEQMLCVRYEDILSNREEALKKISAFINVDPAAYNFEAETPVRGSSTFYDYDEGINWYGTRKTADFKPLKRWSNWSRARHERFNWLAGKHLEIFEYNPVIRGGVFWTFCNLTLDLIWPIRRCLRWSVRKWIPKRIRDRYLWNRGKRYRKFILKSLEELG